MTFLSLLCWGVLLIRTDKMPPMVSRWEPVIIDYAQTGRIAKP